MIVTENLTQIINDLKFVSHFAEDYHYNFKQYKAWENEEHECNDYLKKRNKFAVWGIILTILGVVAFILFINLLFICIEEEISWSFFDGPEWWALPGILFSIFNLMGTIVMFSFGIYMVGRGMISSPKKERQRKKAVENKEYYRNEFERYKTSGEFSTQRNVYINYFPDCKARKKDIDYLIFALQSGRALNFKEALILLDEKKHNDEMQKIAEKTMEYAKRAAEKPSSTSNNYYYH